MADWNKIGRALGGFAAGYGGTGGQYLETLQRADEMKLLQEEKKKKEAQERQQMTEARAANNIRMARERLKERPEAALPAINELIMGIPGADQGPLGKVKQSLMTAMTTGNGALQPGMREQLLAQADQQLRALDDSFVSRGILKPENQNRAAPVTLSRGSQLVDPITGQVVAENPDQTKPESQMNRASAISRAYDNGTTLKVLPDGTTEVTDPAGNVVTGDQRLETLRTAREEQIEFARQRAEAGGIGTGRSDRVNSTIMEGLDTAGSVADLRRGIELLESVQTGGINAIGLRARQLFGVEGADEGELSANLGRAVLSQLKPTFGSAFTEREGARLERMMANFGRNPEVNARLLKQLLAVVERDANRAIDAAISIRDFRTADEIQELLNFKITDGGGDQQESSFQGARVPTVTSQAEYDALPSGAEFIEDGQTFRKP